MNEITLEDYDIGCRMSPSISAGTLMQSSYLTYLLFFAVSKKVDKETGYLKNLGVCIVKCDDCFVTKCGYPAYGGGDLDTLPEHPLAPFGLTESVSSIVKVINSPWSIEVFEQTKKSSARDPFWKHIYKNPQLENLNHFVITFEENTFECIASALIVEAFCQTFDEAHAFVISKFGEY